MSFLVAIVCFVSAVVIIFFFFYYLKKPAGNFYEVATVFPSLPPSMRRARSAIQEEVDQLLNDPANWAAWPEKHLYATPGCTWQIFPFYAFEFWVADNCQKAPLLTQFLKSLGPQLKLATLSKLSPGMKLKPHQGWGQHSNHVLRCHYGLRIPVDALANANSAASCCYVQVEQEKRFHNQDDWLVFDDSKEHLAANLSPDQERLVLIIDMERPAHIPPGTSLIGDTKELMDLVMYFKQRQPGNTTF